jgi:NAD(P)-dependent dehydrogenase (short-subunit alcohol dehydrogenase family)
MQLGMNGKRALITGASRGIGRTIAEKLALEGVHVGLVGRNEELLLQVVEGIRISGGKAEALVYDISYLPNVERLLTDCLKKEFIPDILINNLGGVDGSKNWDSYDVVERVFRLNFLTAYELVRQLLPHLEKMEWGRIVNIGSLSTKNGLNGIPYVISKSALEAFTVFAARDIAQKNPKVVMTMVSPGATAISGKYLDKLQNTNPEALQNWLAENNVSAGRLCQREEIADLVIFLCSDMASYMHGSIVTIDGATY